MSHGHKCSDSPTAGFTPWRATFFYFLLGKTELKNEINHEINLKEEAMDASHFNQLIQESLAAGCAEDQHPDHMILF